MPYGDKVAIKGKAEKLILFKRKCFQSAVLLIADVYQITTYLFLIFTNKVITNNAKIRVKYREKFHKGIGTCVRGVIFLSN